VFLIFFLSYLASPFPMMYPEFAALVTNIPARIGDGFMYFLLQVYRYKAGPLEVGFFGETGFYGEVLANFVGIPTIFFATIGAVRGFTKRNTTIILLTIWVVVIFGFFSSLSGAWPRVILPLVVPFALLASEGLLSSADYVTHLLRTIKPRSLHYTRIKTKFVLAILVIGLILVNLYSAIPAIANQHSAYREAAEFISEYVPLGVVIWTKTQAVLLVYLMDRGFTVTQGDIALLNSTSVIVLDFIARLSSDYPKIEARVSQMRLGAKIPNDIYINMLDSMNFTELQEFESDSDFMSVEIYLNPALATGIPSAPDFSGQQTPAFQTSVKQQAQNRLNQIVDNAQTKYDRDITLNALSTSYFERGCFVTRGACGVA